MAITAPPSATPGAHVPDDNNNNPDDNNNPNHNPAWVPHRPRFEIDGFDGLEQIGRGGQATVYRARRLCDDEIVAIKVFDRSLPTRAGRDGGRGERAATRRFEREVHSLRRVSDHSAVVTLLGSGKTENGRNYIVLEHTGRGSLADVLPEAGQAGVERADLERDGVEGDGIEGDGVKGESAIMSADEATLLGVRIAGALERAHRAGLIHCDIKPGNVLAFDGPDGATDWRLSDFGIATIDSNATENLQLTVVHAAPEVFAGQANTEASDVYALASVVHTALTGHPPFEPAIGETTPAFMHRIGSEPMRDPRDLGMADPIATVLERALDKDPARRHSSARVFGLALNQARASLGLDRVEMAISDGDDDSVTHVIDLDALDMATAQQDARPADARSPRRRTWFVVLCLLTLAVGGIVATMQGGGLGIVPDRAQELAAELVEIVEEGEDETDGNGGGDGDGNNNGEGDNADGDNADGRDGGGNDGGGNDGGGNDGGGNGGGGNGGGDGRGGNGGGPGGGGPGGGAGGGGA